MPANTPLTVEQRILEQAQRLPDDGAVTGWASLRLAGGNFFDGLGADGRTPLRVPLVVPPHRDLRPGPMAQRHRERLSATDIVLRHGVPCTSSPRALFDAMRATDLRSAIRTADMALAARLVTVDEIRGYVERRRGERGARLVEEALRLAEPRTKSPRESDLRLIWVLDARLPRPKCNWPVADHACVRIGRPDLLCEELAVVGEYDGAEHATARRRSADAEKDEA